MSTRASIEELIAALEEDSNYMDAGTYMLQFVPERAAEAILSRFDVHPRGTDWRVLGGVIPGAIPVEWARKGDTIRDNGVTGTVTRIVNTGRMVHLYIDSGHVCFAKVTRQDWVHVISAGADITRDGSAS